MQAHLNAFFRQRHPRINVRRIIIEVDEVVVALVELDAVRDKTPARGTWGQRAKLSRASELSIRAASLAELFQGLRG